MGNWITSFGKFSSGLDRNPPSVGPTVLRVTGVQSGSRGNATDRLEDGKTECLRVVVADFADVGFRDTEVSVQEAPERSANECQPEVVCETKDIDGKNDTDDTKGNGQSPPVSVCKPTPEKVSRNTAKRIGCCNPPAVEADFGSRNLNVRKNEGIGTSGMYSCVMYGMMGFVRL